MPALRDFLDRFRPAGAPGAAARRGVPADRVAELSAELEPVFALLAPVEDAGEMTRREASRRAEQRRQRAREQAAEILADAAARAQAVRAEATARAQGVAEVERTRLEAAARREAARVRARAAERMPALVDRAVALALAALEERQAVDPVPGPVAEAQG